MLPRHRFLLTPRLAAAAGLLLLGLTAGYGVLSWHTVKQDQLDRMQVALELTRKAADNHFIQFEAALKGLALELADDPGLSDLALVQAKLQRFQSLRPSLTAVNLLGPDGKILATAATQVRAALPRATQARAGGSFAEFQARLSPTTTMDLGRPLMAPIAKHWFFPTRYVLRSADGTPLAFLSAAVPVELTQEFWSDTPAAQRASLGLIRNDGYLISLHPAPPQVDLDTIYGSPRLGALAQALAPGAPAHGYVEGLSGIFNQPTGYAYTRLGQHPVLVFVATPLAEFRRAWWQWVQVPFGLALLLGAVGWAGVHHAFARQSAWAAERERAEAALADKRVAEEASRAKTAFMGRMSHELRTPLNAILGFTQILQRDGGDTLQPAQQSALRHVMKAGHQLLALIDDLLQVSHGSASAASVSAAAAPIDAAAPPRLAPRAGRPHELLYIDDDEINRLLMQAYLGLRPSFKLRLAASGPEGLAIARASHPGLVLIDLMMPGMDGLEVLRALRADEALRATPCLAVSANALPEQIDAALRAGFDGYLVKPLEAELLLREVDRHLAGAR